VALEEALSIAARLTALKEAVTDDPDTVAAKLPVSLIVPATSNR
jgi:hypothetical protein